MKKIFLLLLISFASTFIYAQKLEQVKIDPVSQLMIKHTSWERFTKAGDFNSYFRMTQIDSVYFFEMRVILTDPKPLAVKEGQELIFTLSNGETVTLNSFKTIASCMGCGAVTIAGNTSPGIELTYKLTKKQFDKLRINAVLSKEQYEKHQKKQIEHIKITLNPGSIEHELSENSFYQIRKACKLLTD